MDLKLFYKGREPTILGEGFERRLGRIEKIKSNEIQQPQSVGFRIIEPLPLRHALSTAPNPHSPIPRKFQRTGKIYDGDISAQLPDAGGDLLRHIVQLAHI